MNKNFKTFQAFANKCKKSTLPVLQTMKVEHGIATLFDLQTEVCFPVDLENGSYDLILNKPYRIGDLNDDFPHFEKIKEAGQGLIISSKEIIDYAPCVAKDELRPVMEGIYIADNSIVSSNAHVLLRRENAFVQFPDDFSVLFKPTQPILSRCKADKNGMVTLKAMNTVEYNEKTNETTYKKSHVRFEFDDCTITQDLIEGNYPAWRSVVPHWESLKLTCLEFSTKLVNDMTKVARNFGVMGTTISKNGSCLIENEDLTLKETFQSTPVSQPSHEPDGLIMPVLAAPNAKLSDEFLVALSPKMLDKFTLNKGKIIVGVNDADRAMAVWLQPEQQKAPARKPVAAKPETRNSKPVTRNTNPIPQTTQQWYFCRKTNQYLQA